MARTRWASVATMPGSESRFGDGHRTDRWEHLLFASLKIDLAAME